MPAPAGPARVHELPAGARERSSVPLRRGRARLQVLGLSSRDVALEKREQFVRAARDLPPRLRADARVLVLETCHRLEILWTESGVAVERALRAHLRTVASEADLLFTHRRGSAALRHLFTLALGLDSPIPGEREVARQLRRARKAAHERGGLDPLLDRALGAALSATARANTGETHTQSSVAAEAVRQLRASAGLDWRDARVAVLGAGMVAREAVRELLSAPPAQIALVARATRAWPTSVTVRPWAERVDVLRTADIVIVATGADHHLLGIPDIAGSRVRSIVDLALPRNVDPAVGAQGRVELIDLDTILRLRWTPDRTEADRLRARRRVGARELARFRASEAVRAASPELSRLHEDGERLAAEELATTLTQLGTPDDVVRASIESLAERIARRLLYRTSLVVREVASIAAR
jgi:glutamyl-tRNA reductase